MKTTKLLATLLVAVPLAVYQSFGQCSNITVNGSTQNPSSVCAPVVFNMEAKYQFLLPVDTSLVRVLFRWNDGTGATSLVPGSWNSSLDSVWVDASHVYPPTDECSRTAEAILVYNGELCTSSGYQEQTFATWGTDEENSGVLSTDPVVHYVCEGEDIVDVTFADNSTFNCNINIEPDRPNRYYRWVQFGYNTYNQGGSRIPDVSVRDNSGTVYSMTDNAGSYVSDIDGPIIQIPIPADGPNQVSYPISAPAGGVTGDIFEIELRNWNVCNAYDNDPNDGLPPADTVNGDNPPIITAARIEIVAPPPVSVSTLNEFCTGDNISITATAGSAEVRWYKDATLDTLLYTGNTFNPASSPYPVDPNSPGSYTFYVSSFEGFCESAPSTVNMVLYQTPENANAGVDLTICADTITLSANSPSAGVGQWSTTSSATISSLINPSAFVSNLQPGPNNFVWTIINGPCSTSDQVEIISDRQPDPADAGADAQYCDTDPVALAASNPTLGGTGQWDIISGAGIFSDSTNPSAQVNGLSQGTNILLWRVFSQYGACPVTSDSLIILSDLSGGIPNAGIPVLLCETENYTLSANAAVNSGYGYWSVISGNGSVIDSTVSTTSITGLSYGDNQLSWTLGSQFGICPIQSDTINIQRFQTPGIALAGSDKAYCLVNQDTLDGNVPAFGSGSWQVLQNPSGVSPVFAPNNTMPNAVFSVAPGNEGLYQLEWRMVNGPCLSTDIVNIDFGVPLPPANAGPDTMTCGYDYAMQGNAVPIGFGTWTLLDGAGPVTLSPDNNDPQALGTYSPGGEGLYHFEWRLNSGSCPSTADTVEIGIKKAPIAPAFLEDQSCGPDSFMVSVSISDPDQIVRWHETNASPTPFYIGDSYQTNLLTSTTSVFVSIYDTLTHCETNRVEKLFTIDEIPPLPLLFGDTLCGSGQANLNGFAILPANQILWSDDRDMLTKLDTNLNLLYDVNSNTWFYAQALNTNTGCISDVDSVQVVVWNNIPAPVVYPDSSCGPANFMLRADKNFASNTLFWYNSDGLLVGIADTINTAILDSSTSFFVAEYDPVTFCTSSSSELQVDINELPSIPIIADVTSCGAMAFELSPQENPQVTQFRWYNSPMDIMPFYVGDTLTTPLLSVNESYWVSGYNENSGCEGPMEEVNITVYPSPAAIDILGPTVVLLDQSGVVFFTINGQSGSTYTWDIPAEIYVEENMNDFVRLGFPNTGNFTISVYETTTNGCIGTPVYHSISVILDSIAVDLGDFEQGACTAEDFEIQPWLFGGTPPYTYNWTGDEEYLSSTNTLFTTFSPPGTGTFTLYLEVVDVNLKRAQDSIQIQVFESPITSITNMDTIACVDEVFNLNTSSTGEGPFSHLWAGPIHNLNGYTVPNPEYTPRQSDTAAFYYMLTDANGCKAYDSITLISDKPMAEFDILTQPGCSPLTVEFQNTSTGAERYNWYFGDNVQTTIESPVHEYFNTTPEIKYMEVTLVATSPLGCTDSKIDYVMVWPNPQAEITALPQNGCNPAHIMLVSTPGNSLYHWSFGDGSSDSVTGGFNLYHTYTNTSLEDRSFTATVVTESSLECYDTAQIEINVYATPVADFMVSPDELEIPESTFQLENLTDGDWDFTWDFGDGRGSKLKHPEQVEYEEPGSFNITLTARGDHCSDSTLAKIRVRPSPPIAFFKGAGNGCMPHTVTLVNQSSYADSYLWEFGDGSISTAKNPTYTYYESGIYKIKLTVSGLGGTSSFSDTTRVFILPHSFFDLAPRYVYVNDEPVNYFNLSDDADIFEWDFGDGNKSVDWNPKHIYKEEGTYDVTLKVWTENGCFDLYVMENAVFVEPSGLIEYPNAFRPSSPLEENRIFLPGIIDHVDDYHLMIFNRWGELIFESFNQEIGWDGIYNGKLAKQDVYIWRVTGTYTDGKGFDKTGDVTLMY